MLRAASSICCDWRADGAKLGLSRAPTSWASGTRSRNSPNRFDSMRFVIRVTPVTLPPGRLKLSTKPSLTGSPPHPEHDRDSGCGALGRARRRIAADRGEHVDPAAHEIGRHFRQAVVFTARPAEFDRDILALDEATFLQTSAKRLQQVDGILGRTRAHESDDRH